MKKLNPIIAVMALGILLTASCKKCETCTTTTTTTVSIPTPGYPQTNTTTFEARGSNLKDIDGKTTTSQTTSGSITATVTSTTNCSGTPNKR